MDIEMKKKISILDMSLKITYLLLQLHLPGDNDLMSWLHKEL